MRDRRAYLRSVAVVAAGITVAGCSGGDGSSGDGGSDGSDGSGAESTPTATATATPTPTATATTGGGSGASARSEYPDYNWDKLDGVDATDATTVEMTGFSYDPLVARVPAGEPVAFPNTDSVPHTVTAPAASVDVTVQPGEEGTVTVDEPGTYDYVCRFHPPEMLGRLVVVEGLTVDGNTSTDASEDTPTGTDTPAGGGGGGAY